MQFDCLLAPTVDNSRVICSKGKSPGSTCRYQCGSGYWPHPFENQALTCLIDGTWDRPKPCCAKICPPYLKRDILTLKQSRNLESWIEFKSKLVMLYGQFSISNDSARVGLVSYGDRIQNELTIHLADFLNDTNDLLTKIMNLPYIAGGGKNVSTGAALSHIIEKYFGLNGGDRPTVSNIVLVHADDVSSDDVYEPAETLRNMGFTTYAVASSYNNNTEYHQQMLDIAGHPSRLFYESDVTDIGFIEELVLSLCSNPCV
uniref:VWFA domain-containing protein n=1 Tax=Ciona savignyi TaxID=51511 RepID=H2YD84_CIOSA